jgi:hypothetical protein
MSNGSSIDNIKKQGKIKSNPEMSVYSRYGMFDRMGYGFVVPPNRRKWSFNILYQDWLSHGFLNSLCEKGYITVSYAENPFIDFNPSAENNNRHQLLSLSCFIDSCYNSDNKLVVIISPHECGGDFVSTFQRINDNEVIYTTTNNIKVRFRFDPTRKSQLLLLNNIDDVD